MVCSVCGAPLSGAVGSVLWSVLKSEALYFQPSLLVEHSHIRFFVMSGDVGNWKNNVISCSF